METSRLSRRSFLQGAGIAALGAGAIGALSACTSNNIVEQPADERVGQLNTPDWLGKPPEVAESDITETLDYEVVVCGCRTGGLPAIISAAENGARVLGIDRTATVHNPREDIGSIGSKLQIASIKKWPEMKIDKMEAMEDIVRYANGFCRYDLIKLWEDESGDLVDWITDIVERDGRMKMWHEAGLAKNSAARDKSYASGHSPAITKKGAKDPNFGFGVSLMEYAQEKGAEFRWNTNFLKCEQNDDGRVTGVICRDVNDGHYLRINASKGVIISTGGYGNNLEMMAARQPWIQQLRIPVPARGGNPTGDGIKAALWCGGHMDPVGTAMLFNRACVKPDEYAGIENGTGQWFWFGEQPFLKINLLGKRFCNESGPYDYMLHSAWMQPHHTYVDIWDSDYKAKVKKIQEVGCCRLYPFDNGAPSNRGIDDMMPQVFKPLMDAGYLMKDDTMEGLAKKLNLPVKQTVKTWKHYNEMARKGKDTDYNKESYRLIAIDKPPYYGVRTGAWFLTTLDGVIIDTNMHPVDEDENPIQGLYMTGDASGGMFSITYPNLFTGLACGRTMTFGRRAGMLAATGKA